MESLGDLTLLTLGPPIGKGITAVVHIAKYGRKQVQFLTFRPFIELIKNFPIFDLLLLSFHCKRADRSEGNRHSQATLPPPLPRHHIFPNRAQDPKRDFHIKSPLPSPHHILRSLLQIRASRTHWNGIRGWRRTQPHHPAWRDGRGEREGCVCSAVPRHPSLSHQRGTLISFLISFVVMRSDWMEDLKRTFR